MADRPITVITHRVVPETIAILQEWTDLRLNEEETSWSGSEVRRMCREASAMMAFMPDTVDEDFLKNCPKLKIVACALKGYDNFDVDACTHRGVWITIVDDLLTIPTAELSVGLLIGIARHVKTGDRIIRNREFNAWRPNLYGMGLSGRTVGIIGMGKVGQAIAQRLRGFDAELIYADVQALKPVTEASIGVTRLSLIHIRRCRRRG